MKATTSYEFGPYRLDPSRRSLSRDGTNITLAPKTFDLLLLLVEANGRVFTKKELMATLWPDTFVEEANLSFQVSNLRKVLGPGGSHWIETLPRFGYRFSCEIREVEPKPGSEAVVKSENGEQDRVNEEVASIPLSHFSAFEIGEASNRLPRSLVTWAVAAILAVAIAGFFVVRHLRNTPAHDRTLRFQVLPPGGVRISDLDSVTVSPDGEKIAFIGVQADTKRELWLRDLSSLDADELKGTESVEAAFWSPDSRSIGFFANGKLKRLDLESRTVQIICDAPIGRSSGTWNSDDVILFESDKRRELFEVNAKGGTARQATSLRKLETRHSSPEFLSDGRHFIYFVQSQNKESTGIYVSSLGSSESKFLVNTFTNAVPAAVSGGQQYLLFTRGAELLAQPLNSGQSRLDGVPFSVVSRVFIEVTGGIAEALVSASRNGVLAYRTRAARESTELTWFDRQGNRLASVGSPGEFSNPSLSPDEKKLLVSVVDPQIETRDLWLFDLQTGSSSRFTFDPDDEDLAVWSPDGKKVAYNVVHNGIMDLYERDVNGASEPQLLIHSPESKAVRSWTPDGKYLLYTIGREVWLKPMLGSETKSAGPFPFELPQVSPNGKWIAYDSDRSGQSEVYVQSFPNPGAGKWQISAGGGSEPSWRHDGNELFYISGDKLVAMSVRTDTEFEPGTTKPLFELPLETRRRRRYQVAANGQRFLINAPLESSPINVDVNWLPRGK